MQNPAITRIEFLACRDDRGHWWNQRRRYTAAGRLLDAVNWTDLARPYRSAGEAAAAVAPSIELLRRRGIAADFRQSPG